MAKRTANLISAMAASTPLGWYACGRGHNWCAHEKARIRPSAFSEYSSE